MPVPPPHVLLVEPEPVMRRLLERLLQRLGCEVTTTMDSGAALDHLRRPSGRPVALLLMNLGSPAGEGLDATRSLRRFEAG